MFVSWWSCDSPVAPFGVCKHCQHPLVGTVKKKTIKSLIVRFLFIYFLFKPASKLCVHHYPGAQMFSYKCDCNSALTEDTQAYELAQFMQCVVQ